MAFLRKRINKVSAIGSTAVRVFPVPIVAERAPVNTDRAEIGTVWIDVPNDDAYFLTSVVASVSTWINAGGGTGTFAALNVTGAATIGTALTLTAGNLTLGAMATAGVLSNTAAGVIQSTAGTNGQLIIGATAAAPAWGTVTSGDGSVVIALGANTLDLTVSGATASTFPCDGGIATPALGATTLTGGTNITTAGAGAVATINLDAAPTLAGLLTCQLGLDVLGAAATTITSTLNAAQNIYLHANGGVNETIDIHADQGNTDTSVNIHSDAGGVTLDGSATGNIKLTPGTVAGAGAALALNAKVGASTHTGIITASGAQETFTITNNEVSATSSIIVTVSNVGANDCRLSLEQVKPAAGTFEVMTQNNGGAACNGNVIISWIVLN